MIKWQMRNFSDDEYDAANEFRVGVRVDLAGPSELIYLYVNPNDQE